jgi:hypothetical protein
MMMETLESRQLLSASHAVSQTVDNGHVSLAVSVSIDVSAGSVAVSSGVTGTTPGTTLDVSHTVSQP